MNNTSLDQLKNHDAAPQQPLTPTERDRSEALLRSVLADATQTSSTSSTSTASGSRRAKPQRAKAVGWAVAAAGVAAALIVGGAVVAPHLANRLGTSTADAGPLTTVELAGWTSTPTQNVSAAAKDWCLGKMTSGPGAGASATITNQDQRGEVASMIVNRAGYAMLCIVGPDSTGFWELDGTPTDPTPTVAADAITIESAGSHGDGASGFTYVEGYVGSDVTALTVHDAGRTFTATVENGRWTAWWPTPNPHGAVTGTVTITTKAGATHTVSGEGLISQH